MTTLAEQKQSHLYHIIVPASASVVEIINDYRRRISTKYDLNMEWNPQVHCSVGSFYASNVSLSLWEAYIGQFLQHNHAEPVIWNRQIMFSNNALVLLPEETQLADIIAWMKKFHKESPLHMINKVTRPHISIFRKLSNESKTAIVSDIAPIEIALALDTIQITKWNAAISKYEVINVIN